MEEQKKKSIPNLIEIENTQDRYRWVAMAAMLLAISIILHTVSPQLGPVTPNWGIAMYCIVLNICGLSLKQAMGLGFIAGVIIVPSSKSAFPLGNLASDFMGATVCWIVLKAMAALGLQNLKFRPLISCFCGTMASGATFTFILLFVLGLPLKVWIFGMLPVVAMVAGVNCVIAQVLTAPVRRLFYVQEEEDK